MSSQLTIETIRNDFPATRQGIYLNAAARSILSDTTLGAVREMLEQHQSGATRKESWDAIATRCKERFARLIGVSASEIAYTKNVSDGINTVAAAFPWQSGDNVILCSELEHPNNIYPFLNLRDKGVAVRTVKSANHAVDVPAMIAAIDDNTRMVTVASVSFTPGFRTDIEALSSVCRERGIFLMVDAVQSSGVLHIDAEKSGIDGLATATAKGLLGIYGLGFLYIRQAWCDRLRPAYLARFSVDQGTAHESEMGASDFALQPDARRFEVGHHGWAGLAAADASLGQLLAIGSRNIEAHACGLAQRLAEGLRSRGLPVCRPPTPEAVTHIVTVGELGQGGAYSTGDEHLNGIARHLESSGVRFSVRRGLLRFATHVYNNNADIDTVLELVDEAMPSRAAGAR